MNEEQEIELIITVPIMAYSHVYFKTSLLQETPLQLIPGNIIEFDDIIDAPVIVNNIQDAEYWKNRIKCQMSLGHFTIGKIWSKCVAPLLATPSIIGLTIIRTKEEDEEIIKIVVAAGMAARELFQSKIDVLFKQIEESPETEEKKNKITEISNLETLLKHMITPSQNNLSITLQKIDEISVRYQYVSYIF